MRCQWVLYAGRERYGGGAGGGGSTHVRGQAPATWTTTGRRCTGTGDAGDPAGFTEELSGRAGERRAGRRGRRGPRLGAGLRRGDGSHPARPVVRAAVGVPGGGRTEMRWPRT
ncbi:hypothetical protein GCM10018987_54200 [Streptomyces cremeus]